MIKESHLEGFVINDPKTMSLHMLSAAALGAHGLIHWPDLHRGTDAEYLWHYGRASHEIAMAEDFYRNGVRVDDNVACKGMPETSSTSTVGKKTLVLESPQWPRYLLTYAHELGVERLVTVINTHRDKQAFVRVSIPECARARYSMCDAVTKERIVPAEGRRLWLQSELASGALVKVPSMGARMVRIAPREFPFATGEAIDASATHDAYEAVVRAAAGAQADGGVITEGRVSLTYDDPGEDGTVEHRVVTPAHEVWLDPRGVLVGWRVTGREDDVLAAGGKNHAAMDLFWWPRDARHGGDENGDYELIERRVAGGRAVLTVRRFLTHPLLAGLVLTKTIRVHGDAPRIEIDIDIRNEGGLTAMDFAYWSNNLFRFGTPAARWEYPSGERVVAVTGNEKGRNVFVPAAGLPEDQRAVANAAVTQGVMDSPVTHGWMQTVDPASGEKVRLSVDFDELAQIYRWVSADGPNTMEWMSRRITLAPGVSWKTQFSLELRPAP